jgi:hypothetical protein
MIAAVPPIAPGRNRGGAPDAAPPAALDVADVHFGDVLEALNPLQYVPVVGMIYREVTGDTVHPALRIAVSAAASILLGGPVGLAATMLLAVGGEVLGSHGDGATAADWATAARAYHPTRLV